MKEHPSPLPRRNSRISARRRVRVPSRIETIPPPLGEFSQSPRTGEVARPALRDNSGSAGQSIEGMRLKIGRGRLTSSTDGKSEGTMPEPRGNACIKESHGLPVEKMVVCLLRRSSAIYTNPIQALRRDASDVIPLTALDGDWRDKQSSLVPFGHLFDATVDIAWNQRIYFSWGPKKIGSRGVDGSVMIE